MVAPYVSFPRAIGRFGFVHGRRLLPPTSAPRATFLVVPGFAGSGQQYAVQVLGGGVAYVAAGETDQAYLITVSPGVLASSESLAGIALLGLQAAPPAHAVPSLVHLAWIVPPLGSASVAGFVLGGANGVATRDTWYSLTFVLTTSAPRQIVVALPAMSCPG
jgi:hypothetical protein